MLGKNFSRQHFEIFILFTQEVGFGMKFQILFCGKYHKNALNLSGEW